MLDISPQCERLIEDMWCGLGKNGRHLIDEEPSPSNHRMGD